MSGKLRKLSLNTQIFIGPKNLEFQRRKKRTSTKGKYIRRDPEPHLKM